jgi:retinol dehydrogenase-12
VGIGFELTKILYEHNATVYVAGRSKEKGEKAIAALKEEFPKSNGKLEFLQIDLADLSSIKPVVELFLSKEKRLDVLSNNAGVMHPPSGSITAQGYELQLGTNCVGPFLLTKLLVPILQSTAKIAPANSVRVTFASSSATNFASPTNGLVFDGTKVKNHLLSWQTYGQSKAGNSYLAAEFAERYGKDGIISVSFNPGNLRTELVRHTDSIQGWILATFVMYPAKLGAYTELWATCSPDLTASHNGAYIAPWGRVVNPRDDIVSGMKRVSEGGTGIAEKFFEWCDKETEQYV